MDDSSGFPGMNKKLMAIVVVVVIFAGLAFSGHPFTPSSPHHVPIMLEKPCPALPAVESGASAAWVGNGISESSQGKLFKATKLRSFDAPRVAARVTQPGTVPLAPIGELRCEKWAVCTTIHPPTKAMKQLAELDGWCQVIVGDKKTPAYPELKNTVYLDAESQAKLPYTTPNLLKWNHFGRKNIGFLYAIHHGAKMIFDYDDDNELKQDDFLPELPLKPPFHSNVLQAAPALPSSGADWLPLVNPYIKFGQIQVKGDSKSPGAEKIHAWPRGFPLEQIRNSSLVELPLVESPQAQYSKVAVLQSLADHDPDMDGIYRLTQKLPLKFEATGDALVLAKGAMAPWNAQAVLIESAGFFTLLLPITVHGRVTDIWRSYMANRLLADAGRLLAFSKPWVDQYRNAHNYMADFNSELPLYQTSFELIKALGEWRSDSKTMAGRLEDLAIFMFEYGFLERDDVGVYQAWIEDLHRVGYEFPLVDGSA